MQDKKIGILVLQETHLSAKEETSLNNIFHSCLYIISSIDTKKLNVKGITLVLHKNLTKSVGIDRYDIIPGRALMATIPWHNNDKISVLAVYTPNDPTENGEFWEEIFNPLQNIPKLDIMLGDLNIVEDGLDCLPPKKDSQ